MLLESAFHYLFCLNFSFKLVTFFLRVMQENKVDFFSEHSVFLSYLTLRNIITLKFRPGVTQGHWKWHQLIDCVGIFIGIP